MLRLPLATRLQLTLPDIKTLIRIRWYLDDSNNYPIRIADLPALFGLSESKLTRGFKKLFKVKPFQYYQIKSMQWAKSMLEQGMLIKELSSVLLYTNTVNFRRAYKGVHGVYPKNLDRLQ